MQVNLPDGINFETNNGGCGLKYVPPIFRQPKTDVVSLLDVSVTTLYRLIINIIRPYYHKHLLYFNHTCVDVLYVALLLYWTLLGGLPLLINYNIKRYVAYFDCKYFYNGAKDLVLNDKLNNVRLMSAVYWVCLLGTCS